MRLVLWDANKVNECRAFLVESEPVDHSGRVLFDRVPSVGTVKSLLSTSQDQRRKAGSKRILVHCHLQSSIVVIDIT